MYSILTSILLWDIQPEIGTTMFSVYFSPWLASHRIKFNFWFSCYYFLYNTVVIYIAQEILYFTIPLFQGILRVCAYASFVRVFACALWCVVCAVAEKYVF